MLHVNQDVHTYIDIVIVVLKKIVILLFTKKVHLKYNYTLWVCTHKYDVYVCTYIRQGWYWQIAKPKM